MNQFDIQQYLLARINPDCIKHRAPFWLLLLRSLLLSINNHSYCISAFLCVSIATCCGTARAGIVVNSWSLQNYSQSNTGINWVTSDNLTTIQNDATFTRTANSNGVTASTDYVTRWHDDGGIFEATFSLFYPTGLPQPATVSRIIMTFTTDKAYSYLIEGQLTAAQSVVVTYGSSLGPSYFSTIGPFYDFQTGTGSMSLVIGNGQDAKGTRSGILSPGSYVYSFEAEINWPAGTTTLGTGAGVNSLTLSPIPEPTTLLLLSFCSLVIFRRHRYYTRGGLA